MVLEKKYYINLAGFSLIVGLILFLAIQKFSIPNLIWLAYIYGILLSVATYLIAKSGIKKDNKTFLTRIYGSIGIRLIFSIFPIFIYLLFSNVKSVSFVISYVLLYFFYTSFEIYHLVLNLQPDLKK